MISLLPLEIQTIAKSSVERLENVVRNQIAADLLRFRSKTWKGLSECDTRDELLTKLKYISGDRSFSELEITNSLTDPLNTGKVIKISDLNGEVNPKVFKVELNQKDGSYILATSNGDEKVLRLNQVISTSLYDVVARNVEKFVKEREDALIADKFSLFKEELQLSLRRDTLKQTFFNIVRNIFKRKSTNKFEHVSKEMLDEGKSIHTDLLIELLRVRYQEKRPKLKDGKYMSGCIIGADGISKKIVRNVLVSKDPGSNNFYLVLNGKVEPVTYQTYLFPNWMFKLIENSSYSIANSSTDIFYKEFSNRKSLKT